MTSNHYEAPQHQSPELTGLDETVADRVEADSEKPVDTDVPAHSESTGTAIEKLARPDRATRVRDGIVRTAMLGAGVGTGTFFYQTVDMMATSGTQPNGLHVVAGLATLGTSINLIDRAFRGRD